MESQSKSLSKKGNIRAFSREEILFQIKRESISIIKPYIHFPSVFEKIFLSSDTSEQQKVDMEKILKKQQALVGSFLYDDSTYFIFRRRKIKYESKNKKGVRQFFQTIIQNLLV